MDDRYDATYAFGVRYGRFQASAEMGQAAARELLDLVEGTEYLPEPIRVVEIDAAVDALVTAHNGWDNFYNELAPARALAGLVGAEGNIPDAVRTKYMRAVVKAYLGNGHGVSVAAVPYYEQMIGAFDPRLAGRALRAFTDPIIYSVLRSSTGRAQWNSLVGLLEPKLTVPGDRELYNAVRAFTGPLEQLHADTNIARMATPRRIVRRSARTN